MTPPSQFPNFKLTFNPLSTDPTFFPDLQLRLSNPTGLISASPPPLSAYKLGNFGLRWTPPTLWNPTNLPLPPERVENKTLTGAQTWELVENILMMMESLDAKGTRMISNGGEGGCRYEEMAQRNEVEKVKDKCVVKFEPDTHANVNLQVRKEKGSHESLITQFRVTYEKSIFKDEWPDNQVRVLGFQFTPRPIKDIPFYEEITPLTQGGYSIRYMVTPSGVLQIPLLGYPIFKGMAESSDKLDLTHDFLAALGIETPAYFQEAHTDNFKIPQHARDFLKILHHIETDDDKISVVNINKLHKRPKLFDWLSFEKIDWVAHLKEGRINIPNFGFFNFSHEELRNKLAATSDPEQQHQLMDQHARLEIHGTQKQLDASLSKQEFDESRFSIGQHDVILRGLKAEKIGSTLPGLKKLVAKISDGKFSLEDLGLYAENLHIDEMIIIDSKNGIKTVLKNAQIKKFNFDGLSHISAEGISADDFQVTSPRLSMGLHIQKASIPKIQFSRSDTEDKLSIAKIEGNETEINYGNTHVKSDKSSFENFTWTESKGKSQLNIKSLKSSGSIQYQAPAGISFESAGSSQLDNIQIAYENKTLDEAQVSASFDISGSVNKLSMKQGDALGISLTNTQFTPSHLGMTLSLGTPENTIKNIQYDIDLHVEKTELQPSQIGPVASDLSKITKGRIHLIQNSKDVKQIPQIDVSGIFDVHLKQVSGNNESFNIPGLSVTGNINNISLEGPAHFYTTPQGWIFEKPEEMKDKSLTAKAQIEGVRLLHDPHKVLGNNLGSWIHNEVVKTDMKFYGADFSIDDILKIEFTASPDGNESKNHLTNIDLHNIHFSNIKAGGIAWAKFPLFYYMRGVFPQLGNNKQDASVLPSYLSLDRFSISTPQAGKAVTTFEGFKSEVYEVDGNKQFAKVNIPLLRITPGSENIIDTGNNPNEIELYLIDKARGGYVRLKSVPRPLDKRHSRIVKPQ